MNAINKLEQELMKDIGWEGEPPRPKSHEQNCINNWGGCQASGNHRILNIEEMYQGKYKNKIQYVDALCIIGNGEIVELKAIEVHPWEPKTIEKKFQSFNKYILLHINRAVEEIQGREVPVKKVYLVTNGTRSGQELRRLQQQHGIQVRSVRC